MNYRWGYCFFKGEIIVIEKIKIENLTVFEDLEINTNFPINVFIGENGTGKTQLLKFIYLACFGPVTFLDSKTSTAYPFAKKLLGRCGSELVRDNELANSSFKIFSNTEVIAGYTIEKNKEKFGPFSTKIKLDDIRKNLVFIPAKDMLTHSKGLPAMKKEYGTNMPFDESYINIIEKASKWNKKDVPRIAKNIVPMLEDVMDGTVEIVNEVFYIKKRNGRMISFDFEAEGIKKIGLLWQLLMSETITEGTILLWDEPESSLNPKQTPIIADILLELSRNNVQIFLSTHSYFLSKYFNLLEMEDKDEVVFHSLYKEDDNEDRPVICETSDTFSMLANNDIIDEKIRIYDTEVEWVFL